MREGINSKHDEGSDNVTLHPFTFASKSLYGAEWWYSNIEREALGILTGLKKIAATVLQRKYISSLTISFW